MSEVMMQRPAERDFAYSAEQRRPSVGVMSVIYHPDTKSLLVVKEKKSKEATNKHAGEVSLPIETRKANEEPFINLLGSLAEVFDDRHTMHFGETLHLSSFSQKMFHLPNHEVPVDIAVFLYEGPQIVPTPVTTDEVESYGWVPLDKLKDLPLRSVTREALMYLQEDDLLAQAEKTYQLHQTMRRILRQENFSLADFHRNRELSQDVIINVRSN